VSPLVGLLSGSMAKHEGSEEAGVFPLWRALLHAATAQRQQELLEVVERILNGSDDLVTRALR
jgi:hemerythrin superfamily protein